MRERWARWIAVWTGVLVLLIASGFARLQNPSGARETLRPRATAPAPQPASADLRIAQGRRLFDALGCARCHAVAGVGSPRSPLDAVAARRNADELREWIVGAERIRNQLPTRALATKRDYASLSSDQLAALVAYLQSIPAASSAPAQR